MLKILESNPPIIELRDWGALKNLQFTDRLHFYL